MSVINYRLQSLVCVLGAIKFTSTSVFVKPEASLQHRFSISVRIGHVDISLISTSYKAKMAKSTLQISEELTKMKLAETSCMWFNDLSFDKVSSTWLSYVRFVDRLGYSN